MEGLSSGEKDRARSTALRVWRSRPTAPFADVLAVVLRSLGTAPTVHPERLARTDQLRAFDAMRIVAAAQMSLLRGDRLGELRDLAATANPPGD